MLKKLILPAAIALAFAGNAFATDSNGIFTKKKYKIKGSWTITQVDGKNVLKFGDDFKTKNGPDLKIFLSKKNVADLKKNPEFIAPINLGLIDSNKGAQEYILPDDINLDDYESILIHCEAYNILWGGFDIPDSEAAVETKQSYGS